MRPVRRGVLESYRGRGGHQDHRFTHGVEFGHARPDARHGRIELGAEPAADERIDQQRGAHLPAEVGIVRNLVDRQQGEGIRFGDLAEQPHPRKALTGHAAIGREQACAIDDHRAGRLPFHEVRESGRSPAGKVERRASAIESSRSTGAGGDRGIASDAGARGLIPDIGRGQRLIRSHRQLQRGRDRVEQAVRHVEAPAVGAGKAILRHEDNPPLGIRDRCRHRGDGSARRPAAVLEQAPALRHAENRCAQGLSVGIAGLESDQRSLTG